MVECPRLCANCPMAPPGVVVEVTDAEVVTETELLRYRFARESAELRHHFTGKTRIMTQVVASENPNIEPGDTANMLVDQEGQNYEQISQAVRDCKGPAYNWFQRLIKFLNPVGYCGAVNNRNMRLEELEF